MKNNNLYEVMQSAYRQCHSTETALLRVNNDILRALDEKSVVFLILLDLSAAFDTVDHGILLSRLEQEIGICDSALKWFKSYLSGRKQRVVIDGFYSQWNNLNCGVPQGSVLGPVLFTIYTQPLGNIMRKHGISYHLYADDTQMYLSFKPDPNSTCLSKGKMEKAIADIKNWMADNMLKLNEDKTEFLIINAHHQEALQVDTIQIGNITIKASESAKNIGMIFDSKMDFKTHTSSNIKHAFHRLYKKKEETDNICQENQSRQSCIL